MKTTRIELFEMVWETPMIHLAKKLNLSDVGLRKICKKQGIPLPRSGHWTRKQLGKEDARPELPYPNHNPTINLPDEVQAERNRSRGAIVKATKKPLEQPQLRTIEQLHDLRCIQTEEGIKAYIKAIENKTGQSYESVKHQPEKWPPTNLFEFSYFHSRQEQIPIVATARNAIRALCIADEIIERLEKQGIEVILEPRRNYFRYAMYAQKEGVKYEFEFRETWTKATPTTALTKLYKLDTNRDVWRDYIEVPKNVLCIQLNGKYGKMVNDSRVKLEHQVDRLVDAIINALDERIQQRIDRAISERESERRKAIRQHNELIETDRANQFEFALKESEKYAELLRLKEYLLVVEDALHRLPAHQQTAGNQWLRLVRELMNQKSPIPKRLQGFRNSSPKSAQLSGQYWNEPLFPDDHRFTNLEECDQEPNHSEGAKLAD
jgi:hypothetical protein